MPQGRKVARGEDVPPDGLLAVEVEGKALVLGRAEGRVFALADVCPHRGAPLSEGMICGPDLVCPWHGWAFDTRTGARAGSPEGPAAVRIYRVVEEGGEVWVDLEP